MLENSYKMYDAIIEDFVNDIIIKNNITDPFEIFSLYYDFYICNYFSKTTSIRTFDKNCDNNRLYNTDHEIISDKMKSKKIKRQYRGMYMVNGNGVCRHINDMFADILKKAGFKAHKLSGKIPGRKHGHEICGIEMDDKMIYFDAMYKFLPLQEENNKISVDLSTDVYTLTDVKDNFEYDLIFKDAMFKNRVDIIPYISKTYNLDIHKIGKEFKEKHISEYEYISNTLHIYTDPHKILNLKVYNSMWQFNKNYDKKIKELKP